MNIQIMSHIELSRRIESKDNSILNSSVIIIKDIDDISMEFDCLHMIEVEFDDVLECEDGFIDNESCIDIKNFALSAKSSNRDMVISCKGGVSRSAGVASAIAYCLECLYDEEIDILWFEIWRNPNYSPNEDIFKKICEAFGMRVSRYLVDQLVNLNIEVKRNVSLI